MSLFLERKFPPMSIKITFRKRIMNIMFNLSKYRAPINISSV